MQKLCSRSPHHDPSPMVVWAPRIQATSDAIAARASSLTPLSVLDAYEPLELQAEVDEADVSAEIPPT
jgi:hypothetical protein